jgi:hypothetical protein
MGTSRPRGSVVDYGTLRSTTGPPRAASVPIRARVVGEGMSRGEAANRARVRAMSDAERITGLTAEQLAGEQARMRREAAERAAAKAAA